MSSADRPDVSERALLAAGTASYDCPEFPTLGKVADSLRTVVGALEELGFTTVARAPGYRLDPGLASLRAAVRKAAAAAPVVVVYYTGHGADLERGTYYLVGKRSRVAELDESALAARELPSLLTVRDDQGQPLIDQPTALVILDCCYSGSAGMKMLEEALRGIGNPNTWVIASAGALEEAQQGLFAQAFREALQRPLVGPSPRFVSLEAIAQAINDSLAGRAQQQARIFPPASGLTGIPPFFPNPYHLPGVAGMTVMDQQHWLSRVRGGPEESTGGFYLTGKTGRLRAAEDLITWMRDPGPKGLAVVTGSPGTGKSALLALPVLLTETSQREELLHAATPGSLIERAAGLLPVDAPVIAVHARGLNADQIARVIANALDRDASTAAGLLEAFDTAPQRNERVVLVDAVDEATSPAALLGGLLIPLSCQPRLRVVIGARRHVLPAAADADLTIDLDTSQYKDPSALIDYVYRLLIAAEEPSVTTPYQGKDPAGRDAREDAGQVAAVIARRATARDEGPESFLIGRLLALSARGRAGPVDITSKGWQEELPASVAEAFDEDLARLGDKQPGARTLLAALAWAKGPGLPWENIWAPLACALAELGEEGAHIRIRDEDVRWLLGRAGAYIVEDLGPGERSVFRPFHDLLAAHLRGEPSTGQTQPDSRATTTSQERRSRAEMEITRALLATVPAGAHGGPDWLAAHPYLRTYLAQHAAAAGTQPLAALVQDMDFLAVADPATLNPLLSPAVPELRDAARIYRRARPQLGEDPHANAAYLQEAARALTGMPAPSEGAGIRLLYHTYLASVRRDDSLLTITGHTSRVTSVAFGTTAGGRLLLASGGDDGTVRVWDPVTGAPVGAPLTGHTSRVTSVAFGTTSGGRLLLASGGFDKTVRVWDPLTGAPVDEPLTGHTGAVASVAFGTTEDGRLPLLASGGDDDRVRVWDWDPVTSPPVGEPFTGHTGRGGPTAFGTTEDGRLLLASGGDDGTVRVSDPLTGAPVGAALTGHTGAVGSVAFGTTEEGRLLLASGGHDGTVRVWDPVTGPPVGEPLPRRTGRGGSAAFGTTEDGRLLLASSGDDETVRVWDPMTGALVGKTLTGHPGGVASVAFGTAPDGRLLLASGGYDGTVRVWDPLTGTPVGDPFVGHIRVTSVAFGTTEDGRLLLASGGEEGTVRVWDPLTSAPVRRPLTGQTGRWASVPFFDTTAGGRLLREWDPVTGVAPAAGSAMRLFRRTSVAFGTTEDGRLLLASGGHDETVRVWDPVTGALVGKPLTGHTGSVASVAFGATSGGRLLLASGGADGTVRVWDPMTGAPVHGPLTGHTAPVNSVALGVTSGGQSLLVTGGSDRTVRLWEPDNNKVCVAALRRRSSVWSVAIIGSLLAVGDEEGVCVLASQA